MEKQRLTRLNELVCHEFNLILRTFYRDDLLDITVTEVRISPDLHDACVFVSILGDEVHGCKMFKLLIKKLPAIRKILFSKISLKYSPRIDLHLDKSVSRGHRITNLLDSISNE
ncbi:MAG: 30S ribosome-binding factor RbfA [Puniceicoccales bacterium]|jgi:ribosome-binding factor A|nr:30S ribosome-binding factor RbfA [Puniceicoccales bacterium]